MIHTSKDTGPGMLIEFMPNYPIGAGTPIWQKERLEAPAKLGLDKELLSCMEENLQKQDTDFGRLNKSEFA